MKTFQEFVADAMDSNVLWEVMGWDETHGPTHGQLQAVATLLGYCPRSSEPDVHTYANEVSDEKMFNIFKENGDGSRSSEQVDTYRWKGWIGEQWKHNGAIYFYNPLCKSTAADAYECLVQI